MATPRRNPAKIRTLRQHGVLNPHPEAVTDPLFQTGDFFDSQDLLQVKYEMLRRVQIDKAPVTETAAVFGLSGRAGPLRSQSGPKTVHESGSWQPPRSGYARDGVESQVAA